MNSYPKIFTLGHKWIGELLDGEVVVQEKIDGSQFSFGIYDGELKCKSKEVMMDVYAPPAMFAGAVTTVETLKPLLKDGYTYRGECINKLKHNVLMYSRVPKGNVILFDIERGLGDFLTPQEVYEEAQRLGLECVPTFYIGRITLLEELTRFHEKESILGGPKVEGVVIKNYNKITPDKKIMMGKLVRDDFKEAHAKVWGESKPKNASIIEEIVARYRTEARWQKAVQHLTEKGELEGTPRDIGKLIPEVIEDVKSEEAEEIGRLLFKKFWKEIGGGIIRGLPEWYKKKVTVDAFEQTSSTLSETSPSPEHLT